MIRDGHHRRAKRRLSGAVYDPAPSPFNEGVWPTVDDIYAVTMAVWRSNVTYDIVGMMASPSAEIPAEWSQAWGMYNVNALKANPRIGRKRVRAKNP